MLHHHKAENHQYCSLDRATHVAQIYWMPRISLDKRMDHLCMKLNDLPLTHYKPFFILTQTHTPPLLQHLIATNGIHDHDRLVLGWRRRRRQAAPGHQPPQLVCGESLDGLRQDGGQDRGGEEQQQKGSDAGGGSGSGVGGGESGDGRRRAEAWNRGRQEEVRARMCHDAYCSYL